MEFLDKCQRKQKQNTKTNINKVRARIYQDIF